mmetsp:Transcript_43736/g.115537  ORF Transcript_43736/g.115537 Transcript_43736/m.115537 type:complete len:208 (-) Transcript_43736:111-734(-)
MCEDPAQPLLENGTVLGSTTSPGVVQHVTQYVQPAKALPPVPGGTDGQTDHLGQIRGVCLVVNAIPHHRTDVMPVAPPQLVQHLGQKLVDLASRRFRSPRCAVTASLRSSQGHVGGRLLSLVPRAGQHSVRNFSTGISQLRHRISSTVRDNTEHPRAPEHLHEFLALGHQARLLQGCPLLLDSRAVCNLPDRSRIAMHLRQIHSHRR